MRGVDTQGARRRRGWSSGWRAAASAAITRAGRHLQLRDVRATAGRRTSSTSTRSTSELVVRWGRAGETLEAAQRQHGRGRRRGRRDRRRARRRVAGRHHGRRRHRGVATTRRNVYVEAAFWWPEAMPGPLAPLQLQHRRRRTASSAASTPATDGRAHRAHHAADPRHLRRPSARPDGRPGAAACPSATPVTLRVRARRQGASACRSTQAQCADVLQRLGPAVHRGAGRRFDRDAAELALRPGDRGRPDRGGRARRRLRPAARRRRRWRR
ncbi:MAG: hypothetical protein MZW92_56285 [Comamonadaceae bacterium]|nr:hypothetical protein [Comamonadaceae bacterium]